MIEGSTWSNDNVFVDTSFFRPFTIIVYPFGGPL
jgi:hypothetical protein